MQKHIPQLWMAVVAVLSLCLGGCQKIATGPDKPFGAQYSVTVEMTENTCGSRPPAVDTYGTVVLYPREDGRSDLTYSFVWVGGSGGFYGLQVSGGEVHAAAVNRTADGDLAQHVNGTVTPSFIDVVVSAEDVASDGSICVESVRLTGGLRRLNDPHALDGLYALDRTADSIVCPFDYDVGLTGGSFTAFADATQISDNRVVLDVLDDPGEVMLAFDVPDPGATSEYMGMLYGNAGYDYWANVRGTFTPEHVDLSISYSAFGDSTGCKHRLTLVGAKSVQ